MSANKLLLEARTMFSRFTTKVWAKANNNTIFNKIFRTRTISSKTQTVIIRTLRKAIRKLSLLILLSKLRAYFTDRNKTNQNSKLDPRSIRIWPKQIIIWTRICSLYNHRRQSETRRGTSSKPSLTTRTCSLQTCKAIQLIRNLMRMII